MNFSKSEKLTKQKTILIAPLDWGLGHATRCIPIIKEFQSHGFRVIIAANDTQKKIFSEAFPTVEIIFLKGYEVHYSKKRQLFFFTLLFQFPKIFRTIYKEQRWLKKVVKQHNISAVISDNRFGLHHKAVPCIYITHQVAVKTGNAFLNRFAQKIHANTIKKFSGCWVPDFKNINSSLGGQLSHPATRLKNLTYIGCLSRFELLPGVQKQFDIVAVISGPEPQRSIFEQVLLNSFSSFTGNVLLVRGLPGDKAADYKRGNLLVKNHLNGQDLNLAMQQAKMIICRSGYTSLMDLLRIKQQAILIPTPGQAEQEYLANYLSGKKVFYSMQQSEFNLQQAIKEAANFSYQFPEEDMNLYQQVIARFVELL